ncbi:MAG: hypothetical protein P8Y70_13420 [Candidatus Lokiarchaeota archaeon]
MDNEEGFFAHNFSPEFKTANNIFSLESEYARGGSELLMLTIIISEEEPDYTFYESILKKFITKIKDIDGVNKIFYEKADSEGKREINKIVRKIKNELENLSQIITIKSVETEGSLIDYGNFRDNRIIKLSDRIIRQISNKNGRKNVFIVSRTRGEGIKIDIIPVQEDEIVRLSVIFNEKTTIRVVQEISKILAQFEEFISLVFTSGVCQEQTRCIYEVYISSAKNELEKIISEINQIPGVLSVEIKILELQELNE